MENIAFLPAWANIVAAVAVILLIASVWGGNVKNLLLNKQRYAVIAAVMLLGMAVWFFLLTPMQGLPVTYLASVGLIGGCALLVGLFVACESGPMAIAIEFLVVGLLVVFATLMHCSVSLAAIWLVCLIAVVSIYVFLFGLPAKKED